MTIVCASPPSPPHHPLPQLELLFHIPVEVFFFVPAPFLCCNLILVFIFVSLVKNFVLASEKRRSTERSLPLTAVLYMRIGLVQEINLSFSRSILGCLFTEVPA